MPVNNGIFDFDAKKLMPFSRDYVFLGKCHVDYVRNPVSPVIHNAKDNTDWEIEEWVRTLSDDPDVVNLIWEITGACIRLNVSWNKAAWLYSTQGSNGKGTLCTLMRNLCGDENHTAIQLSDFSKDFALESLVKASAIINDENDTDVYIDKAATLGNGTYQKNYEDIYHMLNQNDGVNTAIKNAKRRMAAFDCNKDKPSAYDPGTMVYKLVEELKSYLDE